MQHFKLQHRLLVSSTRFIAIPLPVVLFKQKKKIVKQPFHMSLCTITIRTARLRRIQLPWPFFQHTIQQYPRAAPQHGSSGNSSKDGILSTNEAYQSLLYIMQTLQQQDYEQDLELERRQEEYIAAYPRWIHCSHLPTTSPTSRLAK